MSKKQVLRVPPARPELNETWTREDGIVFTYKDNNKGWVR